MRGKKKTLESETTERSDDNESQSVVKCTLRSALNLPGDRKSDVLRHIDDVVLSVSKLMRRASLFALLHFTRLLEEGKALPTWKLTENDTPWRQLMLLGTPGNRTVVAIDADVTETFKRYENLFPPDGCHRFEGDANILTFAATQLRTAFHTNLWYPIFSRLGRLCKAWLSSIPPQETNGVRCTITCLKTKVKLSVKMLCASKLMLMRAIEDGDVKDLPPQCVTFVREVRSRLGLKETGKPQVLTSYWAKKQGFAMLQFNYWMQQEFARLGVKGARLCPVFGVRRQHVKMDPTALMALAGAFNLLDSKATQSQLRELFNVPGNSKNAERWTGFLSTNGVAASFNFVTPQPKPLNLTAKAARLAELEAHGKLAVLGADPGRHSIIFMATPLDNGQVYSANLTKNKYYASSGIRRATAKKANWDKPLVEAWTRLTKTGGVLRTSKTDDVVAYLKEYNLIAQTWWDHATQRKQAKQEFRVFGGRKRVMDKFFGSVKRDVQAALPNKEIHVAYGAAQFSPSGKGQVSTPTTAAFKGCARTMATSKQGECRTSRQCCKCHNDVMSCWTRLHVNIDIQEEGHIVSTVQHTQHWGDVVPRTAHYQRGLLFCPNCSNYLNRDKSAALNIRFLWLETFVQNRPWPSQFKARRSQKGRRIPIAMPAMVYRRGEV